MTSHTEKFRLSWRRPGFALSKISQYYVELMVRPSWTKLMCKSLLKFQKMVISILPADSWVLASTGASSSFSIHSLPIYFLGYRNEPMSGRRYQSVSEKCITRSNKGSTAIVIPQDAVVSVRLWEVVDIILLIFYGSQGH